MLSHDDEQRLNINLKVVLYLDSNGARVIVERRGLTILWLWNPLLLLTYCKRISHWHWQAPRAAIQSKINHTWYVWPSSPLVPLTWEANWVIMWSMITEWAQVAEGGCGGARWDGKKATKGEIKISEEIQPLRLTKESVVKSDTWIASWLLSTLRLGFFMHWENESKFKYDLF